MRYTDEEMDEIVAAEIEDRTPHIEAAKRFAVQWRDASGPTWEVLDTFDRRGDALLARDAGLAEEQENLPKGRHRAVDLETGTIIEWETQS